MGDQGTRVQFQAKAGIFLFSTVTRLDKMCGGYTMHGTDEKCMKHFTWKI
jgi:hypothetical protein